MTRLAADILVGFAFISTVYWAWALYRAAAFARAVPPATSFTPPVSVLKPLCGVQPMLYENLRTFCEQDYPLFQVVFGVQDADDPAARVVERLAADLPARDITLVTDAPAVGLNPKVNNVVNLYKSAQHGVLVLADSDIRVRPDYLRAVVAPLADAGTGLVTCLYRAVPRAGMASRLGAMYINDWFLPSALVAATMHPPAYAFGATIACRREVLEAIGGFATVADYLADDYILGYEIARSGRRVAMPPYVVETVVDDSSVRALFLHELRWARTIRSVRPLGYLLSLVTYGLPLSMLALVVGGVTMRATVAFTMNLGLRLLGHAVFAPPGSRWTRTAWLVPVRDALSLAVWTVSFFGRTVRWYGHLFAVGPNSRLGRRIA